MNRIVVFWLMIVVLIYAGLSHCLPMWCYTDEKVWIEPTEAFWEGKFDEIYNEEINWGHPGHTLSHLVWLSSYPVFFLELVFSGEIGSFSDFVTFQKGAMKQDIYLLGRIINASFGFMTVVLVYKAITVLIKRKWRSGVGNIPAYLGVIFLVTNGLFLYYSKQARTDIPQTFFDFCGLLLVLLFLESLPRVRLGYMFLFGFVTGLAIMSKWPGAVVLSVMILPVFSILFGRSGSSFLGKMVVLLKMFVLVGLGVLIGTWIASPAWPFYIDEIKSAIFLERKTAHFGADGLGFWGNFVFYQKILLSTFGVLIYFLFWVGVVRVAVSLKMREAIFVFFALVYMVCISRLGIRHARWMNPVLPSFAVVSCCGFISSVPKKWGKVFWACVLIVIITPLSRAFLYNISFAYGDTRVISFDYWEDNIRKENKRIEFEGYTPFLPDGEGAICRESIDYYKDKKVDYIFTSSMMYDLFYAESGADSECLDFYAALSREYKTKAMFKGNPVQWNFIARINYDWDFWRGMATHGKDYLTLPLGPDIMIYSMD